MLAPRREHRAALLAGPDVHQAMLRVTRVAGTDTETVTMTKTVTETVTATSPMRHGKLCGNVLVWDST